MAADDKRPDGFSLKRWSRRKLEAVRESAPAAERSPVVPVSSLDEQAQVKAAPAMPPAAGASNESLLPPVESLTLDSDFIAYLQPEIDESLKRSALKKLFADPHFNVMDGLDVYIDDYTKTVPIPPDILEQLVKARFTFNPPPEPGEKPAEPAEAASIEAPPESPALAADAAVATPSATPDGSLPVTRPADAPSGTSETQDPPPTR